MPTSLQEFVATLKSKLNLVDVASSYISLEKRGSAYWACCPFHHEKTPSFAINEADQYYHCFGCGESGDLIKFVREMENVEFIDAVKLLAERAGLEVPESDYDAQSTVEAKRKRDSLLKIMNASAHFYLDNLNSGKADKHIEYILKRQIPSNIVRTFGLGASLNFNDLPKFLLAQGFSKRDIVDSGAVNDVDGRLSDALGGRLIIPIIDAMGQVVAFGGRLLEKADFAKYKNTKDTLLFNKRKTLYNINLLKKLRKTQTIKDVIMVEGYMDVISLYQAGFKNVVASMGTSLTQEQARLLKRYTDNVYISYDGDKAGQSANIRGLEILKSEGLNVKVVPLPDGLDPDDVIKQLGAEGYEKCLEAALPLIDYKVSSLEKGFDLSKTDEKRKFVSEALKIVRTAESAVEKEGLLKRLRDVTGYTYESLARDLESAPQPPPEKKEEQKPRADEANVNVKASRYVIAAYLFGARFTEDIPIDSVPFCDDVHNVIANYLKSKKLLEEKVQPSELFEFFDENMREYEELCRILDYGDGNSFSGEVAEKFFKDCLQRLKLADIGAQISEVAQLLSTENDAEKRKSLSLAYQQLLKRKEKIKNGD